MGSAIKHPVPDQVKPSFVNFCHPGTLTLRAKPRSAKMSKIETGVRVDLKIVNYSELLVILTVRAAKSYGKD